MLLLQAHQVSRQFADVTLFENVSFSIQTQDRIALVGRNGAGKSTLIKQIMGSEPISAGTISKAKDLKIGYLEQHVATHSTRTIWDEMLSVFDETLKLRQQAQDAADTLALLAEETDSDAYQKALQTYDNLQETLLTKNAYAIESEIRTVLHGFRFYETNYDTPVDTLSGGQKTRLALAQILLMDYDLLILDEPTNHLDMQMLAWLEQYLTGYKGALLIVSHDRYFLDKVATQVIELRHQTLHTYKGNYSFYVEEKERRLEQEFKQFEQQQATIQKLEDFVQKNIARASTTKRAQSRRKQLEKMTKLAKPKQDPKAPRIQFLAEKESGERVIEANNLCIGYEQPLAQSIEIDLRKQEAIAIVGPNGIGKSTLLKTLIGTQPALSGHVTLGTNVQIGYYDQSINHLNPQLSVLQTLWQAHDTLDERVIRSILGSFLFSGESVDKKVSMLSGGEKARLSLALLAMAHDNTLLLDEPTNHLDIDSKEVLEEALIDFDGTLLFVSHDRYFINRIATQIIELSPEGTTLYLGDYDYYLEKKKAQQTSVTTQSTTSSETPKTDQLNYEQSKTFKREVRKLESSVEQFLQEIDTVESHIQHLHEQLARASEQNDQSALVKLHEELLQAESQHANLLEKWEHASEALETYLNTQKD
ncbi:MAG: ABC-F family ATP-binding cassette domain-containing protein [Aerococcaceae bacterium]|nr:ABC-F family ATP-binding cassette domain-containing protein [Aerococcaceae bacterium]